VPDKVQSEIVMIGMIAKVDCTNGISRITAETSFSAANNSRRLPWLAAADVSVLSLNQPSATLTIARRDMAAPCKSRH